MKLSIILPAYNVESYLDRCVMSIENQDLPHSEYEIIIVDDGSTDGTYQKAMQIAQINKNVKAYTQPNQGQSGARNKALDYAKGEYVWFVDSDDYIKGCCLRGLYETAKNNDLDALYFVLQRHYEGDEMPSEQFECRQTSLPSNTIMSGVEAITGGYYPCSSCAAIYRREKLNNENLRFKPGIFRQDVEFTFRSIPAFNRIMFLDEAYYLYFTRHGSVTTSTNKDVIIRRMLGDGHVAKTCFELSLKHKDNENLSKIFLQRYQGVMLGVFLTMWKERKVWRKSKISATLYQRFIELGIFPIKGPYKNIKQRIVFSLFNKFGDKI